jgi:hypothetical protein
VYISGNLLEPVLEGSLDFKGVDVTGRPMPEPEAQPLSQPAKESFPVNPQFKDIRLATVDAVRLRSTSSIGGIRTVGVDTLLHAKGALKGSMSNPVLDILMDVESGRISLPTARLLVEPGSKIHYVYSLEPGKGPTAHLDLNIDTRTSIVTRVPGLSSTVDRYDVQVKILGDLFDQEHLKFIAQSDSPELTSEMILKHLIRLSDLTTPTRTPGTARREQQIGERVLGFALPLLVSPLFEGIGSMLGFDYIGIDSDPVDGLVLVFAKSLAKGLTLQGFKTFPLIYRSSHLVDSGDRGEIKLSYRLPVRNSFLSRAVIGVSIDQSRSWKISLEYGVRL